MSDQPTSPVMGHAERRCWAVLVLIGIVLGVIAERGTINPYTLVLADFGLIGLAVVLIVRCEL